MRRTDLSRRLGKVATSIENEVANGKDIRKVICNMGDEIGLKAGKVIKTPNKIVVPYKDNEFEGTLKRTDIVKYDAKTEELGIKDITTKGATAQIIYLFDNPDGSRDSIEIRLLAEVEYFDNLSRKHKAYPCLKNWVIEMEDIEYIEDEVIEPSMESSEPIMIEEVAMVNETSLEGVEEVEDDVLEDDDINTEIEDDGMFKEDYKNNINVVLNELFSKRFFGTVPSKELVELVIKKIHGIYLVTYLEDLYSSIDDIEDTDERVLIVQRILNII